MRKQPLPAFPVVRHILKGVNGWQRHLASALGISEKTLSPILTTGWATHANAVKLLAAASARIGVDVNQLAGVSTENITAELPEWEALCNAHPIEGASVTRFAKAHARTGSAILVYERDAIDSIFGTARKGWSSRDLGGQAAFVVAESSIHRCRSRAELRLSEGTDRFNLVLEELMDAVESHGHLVIVGHHAPTPLLSRIRSLKIVGNTLAVFTIDPHDAVYCIDDPKNGDLIRRLAQAVRSTRDPWPANRETMVDELQRHLFPSSWRTRLQEYRAR